MFKNYLPSTLFRIVTRHQSYSLFSINIDMYISIISKCEKMCRTFGLVSQKIVQFQPDLASPNSFLLPKSNISLKPICKHYK